MSNLTVDLSENDNIFPLEKTNMSHGETNLPGDPFLCFAKEKTPIFVGVSRAQGNLMETSSISSNVILQQR